MCLHNLQKGLQRLNMMAAGREANNPMAHQGTNSTTCQEAGSKHCRLNGSPQKAAYSCVVILSHALKAALHGLGIQA